MSNCRLSQRDIETLGRVGGVGGLTVDDGAIVRCRFLRSDSCKDVMRVVSLSCLVGERMVA